MNKTIHGLIALCFAFACLCLWGMLTLSSQVILRSSTTAPAFTRFCIGLRPTFVVLPILAAAYCLYVWMRKTGPSRSWVPYFAATTGLLVITMLPTLIAVWLPFIHFMAMAKN